MSTPKASDLLHLNVSGRKYAINERTIKQKLDGTLFSSLHNSNKSNVNRKDADVDGIIRVGTNKYFVERTPGLFELVLHYGYTGQLHCPQGVCMDMLMDEVRFWRLPERKPNGCCAPMSKMDIVDKMVDEYPYRKSTSHLVSEEDGSVDVMKTNRGWRKLQATIWRLFDDPASSWGAKVIHAIAIFFIFLSIISLVLSTVPSLHRCTGHEFLGVEPEIVIIDDDNSTLTDNSTLNNDNNTLYNITLTHLHKKSSNKTKTITKPTTTAAPIKPPSSNDKYAFSCEGGLVFDIIETVCIIWFTFEWITRFIVCPNKVQFFKSPLNIIDLLATFPYYLELLIGAYGVEDTNTEVLAFFRILRAARVLRIFRLARYFTSLQVMGETLWNSRSELGLLVMFLAVSTIIFSTLIYYIERDAPDSKYTSIPASFYWCIVTLTTVGYGDVTPSTILGKVVTGCACITGVLILAFPVSILVEKFQSIYENNKQLTLKKAEEYLRQKSLRKSISKTSNPAQVSRRFTTTS